jgi:hypothetical protein
MHNVRLADKYDSYTQAIAAITSKKTNRTEADDAEIGRLEWYGGLYHAADLGVYIPAANIVTCLANAAKITKEGAKLKRGVSMLTDRIPLVYTGPRDPAELFVSPEFRLRKAVGVHGNTVMRVRPIFQAWALAFEVEMAEDVLNVEGLQAIAERAGRSEGLGDARILGYGRFHVTVASDLTHAQTLLQQRRNGSPLGAARTSG